MATYTTPQVSPTALWEDFVDIFYSPRRVFERRQNGRWGVVFFALTTLLVLLSFEVHVTTAGVRDTEFQRAVATLPQSGTRIPEGELRAARSKIETIGTILVALTIPVKLAISGLVIWGVAALFGARWSFGNAMTVSIYASFPLAVQGLSIAMQAMVLDSAHLTSHYAFDVGIARLLDPVTTPLPLLAAVEHLNIFVLWEVLLVALGVRIIAPLSWRAASATAACMWLAGLLPALVGSIV